ncbi:MAG: isocitrate/isopropylmalate family dehydrogenase [Proteobacteria bacterium]|nr:isocitrate/isopropylmalate family dehydrogenase [Pseudomonadota bacterium]
MSDIAENNRIPVSLIPGDGIGPEITEATQRVVEAAGGNVEWQTVPAGMSALDTDRDPLPPKTIDSITQNQLALKGPLATPAGGGFRSINVALRQHFDLYANVRPAKSTPGVPSRFDNVDIVLIRENTEGMYSGIEHYVGPSRNAAESIAIITRHGSERIVRFAFDYARNHNRKKVTLIHKANILKMTDGLFLEVGRKMAEEYPDIEFNDMIVDATAMNMVVRPEQFDVIVTMNLFGDILSDLSAGLIGGLGVAPAANIGEGTCAIFEAVHGTAPDIAGKGMANPTALMRSAAMLLDHIDQTEAAGRMHRGIDRALADDATRTRDLGGKADTTTFTDAVINNL